MRLEEGTPVTGDGIAGTIINVSAGGHLTHTTDGTTRIVGVELPTGEVKFWREDRLNAEKVGAPPEGETPTEPVVIPADT